MTASPPRDIFDELALKSAQSGGAMPEMTALFEQVFALPSWHFVMRGTPPDVHPYVAANANYADGKHMVRAFTDTDRLLRFARENNLLDATGGAPVLTIPTKSVVAYLEQFASSGVFGVWFNSDTGSEGFFGPLASLRAIEAHVAAAR